MVALVRDREVPDVEHLLGAIEQRPHLVRRDERPECLGERAVGVPGMLVLSSGIVAFRLDPETGAPYPTGRVIDSPVPVCLGLL